MKKKMQRTLTLSLLLTTLGAPALGQDTVIPGTPHGWLFGGDIEKFEVGTRVPPSIGFGTQVAYIKAGPDAQCGDIAALYQTIAADKYRGKRLKFSARLRGGTGAGGASSSMFMFLSGPVHTGGVHRPNWLGVGARDRDFSYNESVTVGVPANAEEITFGFRVIGPRGASMDAVRLEVVGDYQPPPQSSVPASKAGTVGNFDSRLTNGLAVHGRCGYQYSRLIARGRYELDERSLSTMARRSAPQGVQAALAAE